jgi:hypothetical protein
MALGLSLVGAAVLASLSLLVPYGTALRAAVTLVAFVYVCGALARTSERTGRVVVMALWCAIAAGAWMLGAPIGAYIALQAGLLWLVRALYSEAGAAGVGADLLLTAASLAFGVWAALRTETFFLAAWCFFLIQSLHVFIPALLHRSGAAPAREERLHDAFDTAFRAAEDALGRLMRAR